MDDDLLQLPLNERLNNKNWKARQSGFDELAQRCSSSFPDDPIYAQYARDLPGAILDANMIAQEAAMGAVVAFLEHAPQHISGAVAADMLRPTIEKAIAATRAGTRQKANEVVLLVVEVLERGDEVLEALIAAYTHKLPKLVAAAVAATRDVVHQYGVHVVNCNPLAGVLANLFGHADKNVRAEATNLTVTLYSYLGDAVKPFLESLKPVQQKDLEAEFANVANGGQLRPTRAVRSQKAAMAAAGAAGGMDTVMGMDHQQQPPVAEMALPDPFDFAEPVDVLSRLPPGIADALDNPSWKVRKEAIDALLVAVSVPRIADGRYAELVRAVVARIGDTNIVVATVAVQVLDKLARGLRGAFGPYTTSVIGPLLDKTREKRSSLLEAVRSALDATCDAGSLDAIQPEVLAATAHKIPQIRTESIRFLTRCFTSLPAPPSSPDVKAYCEALVKAMDDSTTDVRDAAAQALGTLAKVVGDRLVAPYVKKLDPIRLAKVQEYAQAAVVKGVAAPLPPAAAPARAPGIGRAMPPVLTPPPPMAGSSGGAVLNAMEPPRAKPPSRLAARLGRVGASSSRIRPPAPAPVPAVANAMDADVDMSVDSPPRVQAWATTPPVRAGIPPRPRFPGGGAARPMSSLQQASHFDSPMASDVEMDSAPATPTVASGLPRPGFARAAPGPAAMFGAASENLGLLPASADLRPRRAAENAGSRAWVADSTRPDLMHVLHEQAMQCFTPALVQLMFSKSRDKGKDYLRALDAISAAVLTKSHDAIFYADVIFKYLTVRLLDPSPTTQLRCFEIAENLLGLMRESMCHLSDYEAMVLVPTVLAKLGDLKNLVRSRALSLLTTIEQIYPTGSLFTLLLQHGIHHRNSRVRVEVINVLTHLIATAGAECCPVRAVPDLAKLVGERDPNIKKAALELVEQMARSAGEAPFFQAMGNSVPDATVALIRQRLRKMHNGPAISTHLPPAPPSMSMGMGIGMQFDDPVPVPPPMPHAAPATPAREAMDIDMRAVRDTPVGYAAAAAAERRRMIESDANFPGMPVEPAFPKPAGYQAPTTFQPPSVPQPAFQPPPAPAAFQPPAAPQPAFQPPAPPRFVAPVEVPARQPSYPQDSAGGLDAMFPPVGSTAAVAAARATSAEFAVPAAPAPHPPRSASWQPPSPSSDTSIDLILARIGSGNVNEALVAARQIERLLLTQPQVLHPHADGLVVSLALQTRLAFQALNQPGAAADVFTLCRKLLAAQYQLFATPALVAQVKEETLEHVLAELLARVADPNLVHLTAPTDAAAAAAPGASAGTAAAAPAATAGANLARSINLAVVRLVDHVPPNTAYRVILRLLARALRSPDSRALADLAVKTWWRALRNYPAQVRTGQVEYAPLLADLHAYCAAIDAQHWKQRPEPLRFGDAPVRTVKAMIKELVGVTGEQVLQWIELAQVPEGSYVVQATLTLLANTTPLLSAVAGGAGLGENGSGSAAPPPPPGPGPAGWGFPS
ncbi:Microtubule-associated protein, microtubule dynamics during spindle orientation [Allomyces arbusculus]|nr:Microtubule-associated protein, microtubule dynamics during spindle orientation [Allomyces arbusculus]